MAILVEDGCMRGDKGFAQLFWVIEKKHSNFMSAVPNSFVHSESHGFLCQYRSVVGLTSALSLIDDDNIMALHYNFRSSFI
jgi:hypothetical protein